MRRGGLLSMNFLIYLFAFFMGDLKEEIGDDNMISLRIAEQMLYYFPYNMDMLIFYICSILITYHK